MLENSYRKNKSMYTKQEYDYIIDELNYIREKINVNKKIEFEKVYIKQVIKSVENECNRELNTLYEEWKGTSGKTSTNSLEDLITNYKNFLEKIQEFIDRLENASQQFASTESENISRY